jgi:hypothetical protein
VPEYVFESEEEPGVYVEEFFSMSEAPKIGQGIERDGKRYVRVPCVPRAPDLTHTWRHKGLTSNQWHPFVGKGEGWHSSYDREGRPQFENKRQAREFARRYSDSHPTRETSFDG